MIEWNKNMSENEACVYANSLNDNNDGVWPYKFAVWFGYKFPHLISAKVNCNGGTENYLIKNGLL